MKRTDCMETRALCLVHWPERLLRSVAWLVIVCFLVRCLTPTVLAAETLIKQGEQLATTPAKSEMQQASEALIALENTLDRMNRRLHGEFEFAWQTTLAGKTEAKPAAAATRAELTTLHSQLLTDVSTFGTHRQAIQSYFAETLAHLGATHAAPVILQRANAQAEQAAKLSAQLDTLLAAIQSADSERAYMKAVAAATEFMHQHSSKPKRAEFDPEHLAFDFNGGEAQTPLTEPQAVRQARGLPEPSEVNLTQGAPEYLAATEDAQITPAISAKAQELDNNPLKIYQFVRNKVEYLPTYGSIEGSDYTLQTLRGNDMDQASLLIALLRAADIPARYVYGTVRMPIDKVKNWVGNVSDPEAALNLMAQGGVPVVGLTEGGVFKYARIEHVWVEAQIAYAPSRGAVTTAGDIWIPMDPSFKQYTYTEGMHLGDAVPFDAEGFAEHIEDNSTINEDEGWVQGVDQDYIEAQLADYQSQVGDYVDSQNPGATVGDVIGTKIIKPETLPLLPATLPYAVTAVASRMAVLPVNLRWKFRYKVDGQTMISKSLPSLAGHHMALSFSPATDADKETLQSYIPDNVDDASDLPESLPAGVVNLTSQFSIDGETAATGPTYALGDPIAITMGMYQPNAGWRDKGNTFTAGDFQAVGVDGVSTSKAEVQVLQAQLEATKAALETGSYNSLTKHDLTGALMQTSLMNYFAQIRSKAALTAQMQAVVSYPLPSYGTISTYSEVALLYGMIPTSMTPTGVSTDMDRIAWIGVNEANDTDKWKAWNETIGSMMSRAESGVLEQQYSTPTTQLHGITAVQALAIASTQGQRIYTISADNAAIAMGQLNLQPAVMQEIANAVNAGLVVTTSQAAIDYNGTSTSGYIITDPDTGAAAYKIASGANGGFLTLGLVVLFVLLAIALYLLVAIAIFAALTGALIVAAGAVVAAVLSIYLLAGGELNWCLFFTAFGLGMVIAGVIPALIAILGTMPMTSGVVALITTLGGFAACGLPEP